MYTHVDLYQYLYFSEKNINSIHFIQLIIFQIKNIDKLYRFQFWKFR